MQGAEMMKSRYVTVGEAARILELSPQYVRRLCNRGELSYERMSSLPKSHRRLLREDVERYRAERSFRN